MSVPLLSSSLLSLSLYPLAVQWQLWLNKAFDTVCAFYGRLVYLMVMMTMVVMPPIQFSPCCTKGKQGGESIYACMYVCMYVSMRTPMFRVSTFATDLSRCLLSLSLFLLLLGKRNRGTGAKMAPSRATTPLWVLLVATALVAPVTCLTSPLECQGKLSGA